MSNAKLDGEHLWERFDSVLASYAQKNQDSRGRKHPEPSDPDRLPFQRDRDRIIHTSSFRRLRGKMQVVTPATGDHFRNRLSHTIEVAQTSRDLARLLHLNEDLAEAIALAHDLGHPPFGHAGESTLHKKMEEQGFSFDHNEQSLRVVEFFERRYPDFSGLNLTHEVLEGIQKHEHSFSRPEGEKVYWPHLEGQLVDIADEISYLSADIDDGLRGGFLTIESLIRLQIIAEAQKALPEDRKGYRSSLIRRIIRDLLAQLIADTKTNLNTQKIRILKDVQECEEKVVQFSPAYLAQIRELRSFLHEHYYMAPEVEKQKTRGQQMIAELFDHFLAHPDELPESSRGNDPLPRRVCDYIAGMTDRFAFHVWEKIGK